MTEQVPSDQLATPKTDAAEIAGYECDRRQSFVPADFARAQERAYAAQCQITNDMVERAKEAEAKVTAQERRIAELEDEIADLKRTIHSLEHAG